MDTDGHGFFGARASARFDVHHDEALKMPGRRAFRTLKRRERRAPKTTIEHVIIISGGLSFRGGGISLWDVKEKLNRWLPWIFVALFAVSRIPQLLPWNFSLAYAFAFCAGVYFPRKNSWW